jgi:hypothetical protein
MLKILCPEINGYEFDKLVYFNNILLNNRYKKTISVLRRLASAVGLPDGKKL